MAQTIAIIGALEKEVRQVYEVLEDPFERAEAGLTVVGGTYQGVSVVATVAGMGTVNAAAAAQHLITAHGADAVIFSGIAGGLNPRLHIADVVVGERLRYLDTDTALVAESAPGLEEFTSTPELVAAAENVLRGRGYVGIADASAASADVSSETTDAPQQYLRGIIATGDRFVAGESMRAAAIEATGADCVEMEGAAVAHVAAKNGVSCLVLRAISDNCDESYDALSTRTFDLDEYARSASSLVLDIIARI